MPADDGPWVSWLWAWENPQPEKMIAGFRFEPAAGAVVISAISAGDVVEFPLRWQPRRKARLVLPEGETFRPDLDGDGLLEQIRLDLGQVISAAPRLVYPNDAWQEGYNNQLPELAAREILVEYTAHPEACFHLAGPAGSRMVPVAEVEGAGSDGTAPDGAIHPVAPAEQMVTLRVVERSGGRPVPVKLHIHGESGEYLAPVDRHRILNPAWFEDYSVDFSHILDGDDPARAHACTYINGETTVKLPLGKVYIEVPKGFEIRPVRKVVEVTPETQEIDDRAGEGAALARAGLGDGRHARALPLAHLGHAGGSGRGRERDQPAGQPVGRADDQRGRLRRPQHLGFARGRRRRRIPGAGGHREPPARAWGTSRCSATAARIIAPMTTGGPDESALGDPVDILLTEWARQCRSQGGLVVVPHFPNPRAEHAAAIVSGDVDAVEMTSWENHYNGIDPYSLSDWYRYLNCGYLVPAVGGTDKMAAATAVGTVRTYARIDPRSEFSYESWMEAVRRGETFVTYGPLLEFTVDGQPMGSRIAMTSQGGTVDVAWQAASVTVPMTRVELVVNGEIRESAAVAPGAASGHWSVKVDRSAWLALLVRGHQPGKPEMIAAHGTPVMVTVEGSPLLAAADAVTILDQIEGAIAYLDTVGTRAEDSDLQADAAGAGIRPSHPAQSDASAGALSRACADAVG